MQLALGLVWKCLNKYFFTKKIPEKKIIMIEISLHFGVPDKQILFHLCVRHNQILLHFVVPDNQLSLHFGVPNNKRKFQCWNNINKIF